MAQVLIVDDDPGFTSGIAEFLRLQDHRVATANSVSAARQMLKGQTPDVLFLDLMLPDGSGLEVLGAFGKERPAKVVIMTGHSGVKSLIEGIAGDGVTYLTKPVEPRELLGIVNAVHSSSPDDSGSSEAHFGLLIGESEAMHSVYEKLRQVAPTDSTVFVQGESGTGKEL
ncbi:MAG: response regulator, partial [Halioglobus sp.]|nr:response regulator [Halioglobus sp.]